MDSSYDTANSPSENFVTTRFPNGHPKLAQIFSARYLVLVPEKTKKEFCALIFIIVVFICVYIL